MRNEGGLLILLMLVLFFLKTWLRRSLSHPIGCRSWEKCAFSSSHAFLLLTSLRLENEKRASNSSSELPASSSSLLLLSKERSEKSWRDILALACCSSWSAGGMLSAKRGARRERSLKQETRVRAFGAFPPFDACTDCLFRISSQNETRGKMTRKQFSHEKRDKQYTQYYRNE